VWEVGRDEDTILGGRRSRSSRQAKKVLPLTFAKAFARVEILSKYLITRTGKGVVGLPSQPPDKELLVEKRRALRHNGNTNVHPLRGRAPAGGSRKLGLPSTVASAVESAGGFGVKDGRVGVEREEHPVCDPILAIVEGQPAVAARIRQRVFYVDLQHQSHSQLKRSVS
jgi:hypothetical protein